MLALVMVGLPARGKTYTARKIARYLSWRGHRTEVFNVGNYRRKQAGAHVSHQFFDPTNPQGMMARRHAAESALRDMIVWFRQGGEVGIYDATNSLRERREWVQRALEAEGIAVAFIESICDDSDIIDANIQETKLASPDYVGVAAQEAVTDFRARIAHYHSVYETIIDDSRSWIKIVDAGRQVIINRFHGFLQTRIASFLMNLHLIPRTFWLTRHGQSVFNHQNRIGGDSPLSEAGERYRNALSRFFARRPVGEIWTSTLQRTIQTASPLLGSKKRQWKALDEIDAGVCDGMTYGEIEEKMPGVFQARKSDKFRYRYPQGESYEDLIGRLEPVIFELERTRSSTLVVAHQAVLRALYAYFVGKPREECPFLPIPLHTVIQFSQRTYSCDAEPFFLGPDISES